MRRLAVPLLAAATAAAVVALRPVPALAGFDLASQPGDAPVEVTAEQGMEWSQDGQRITARGKARAVRGNVTVIADTLVAFYSQVDSQTQISRLEAHGNVTIKTPTEEATGTQAIYDVPSALMTLKGGPAKIVTATDTITARDGIEYNENTKVAVARGDAMDIRQDRRVRADVLTATFSSEEAPAAKPGAAPAKKGAAAKPAKPTAGAKPGAAKAGDPPNSKMTLEKAHAQGKVVVTSPTDIATGDVGDYDAKTGIVTLSGSVKITRGENQLNGGYAQFNMNSGVASMLASAPGTVGRGHRVQGLFTPQKDGQNGTAGKDKTNGKRQ